MLWFVRVVCLLCDQYYFIKYERRRIYLVICLVDIFDFRVRVLVVVVVVVDGVQDEVVLGVVGLDFIWIGLVFGVDNVYEFVRNVCDFVIMVDSGCVNGCDMRNDSCEGDNFDQMYFVDVGRLEGGGDYEVQRDEEEW